MDIQLAGQLDGIETAKIVAETTKIPIIFMTANVDDKTFEKSKEAFPYAFLSKPFKSDELVRTIELIFMRKKQSYLLTHNEREVKSSGTDNNVNTIFIRDKDKMVKVNLSDVHYIEADRNYSIIYTVHKTYLISSPLKRLKKNKFIADLTHS